MCQVGRDGRLPSRWLRNSQRETPEGAVSWWTLWKGPESVIYGHAVHSLVSPRIDEPQPGIRCIGIDTGCVFGGRLTAAIIDKDRDRSAPPQ
jgi:diadenosine tetraphosphatase ApaH/serine/threonine PP2A family protein phosphatase